MPPVRNPYEAWELEIISTVYPLEGTQGCIDRGVNRNPQAIRNKAAEMGIRISEKYLASIARKKALEYLNNKQNERTPWELPVEYLGATDIFQVGYLVAQSTGTLEQFVGQR